MLKIIPNESIDQDSHRVERLNSKGERNMKLIQKFNISKQVKIMDINMKKHLEPKKEKLIANK